jgi:hypothetical protein
MTAKPIKKVRKTKLEAQDIFEFKVTDKMLIDQQRKERRDEMLAYLRARPNPMEATSAPEISKALNWNKNVPATIAKAYPKTFYSWTTETNHRTTFILPYNVAFSR